MSAETTTNGMGTEEKPYNLVFDEYIWKGNESEVQAELSGIYCFYAVRKNANGKEYSKLLYIGKALDLRARFLKHSRPPKGFKQSGEVEIKDMDDYLCDPEDVTRKCFYAYAELDGRSLEKCEAAMIKEFQPIINIQGKKTLGCHDESYFKIDGKHVYGGVSKGTYHVEKD